MIRSARSQAIRYASIAPLENPVTYTRRWSSGELGEDRVEQRQDEGHVVDAVLTGIAAATARVPGEQPVPAGPVGVDHHEASLVGQLGEPGLFLDHRPVATAAVQHQHQRHGDGRGGHPTRHVHPVRTRRPVNGHLTLDRDIRGLIGRRAGAIRLLAGDPDREHGRGQRRRGHAARGRPECAHPAIVARARQRPVRAAPLSRRGCRRG